MPLIYVPIITVIKHIYYTSIKYIQWYMYMSVFYTYMYYVCIKLLYIMQYIQYNNIINYTSIIIYIINYYSTYGGIIYMNCIYITDKLCIYIIYSDKCMLYIYNVYMYLDIHIYVFAYMCI